MFYRLPLRLLYFERYGIEVILFLSSLWAAFAFGTLNDPFPEMIANYFFLLNRLEPHNHVWAGMLLLSVTLQIGGLVLCKWQKPHVGVPCRYVGATIAGTFWFLAGLSALIMNHHTLAGVPLMLMGVSSWWLLIRTPAKVEPPP